MCFSYEEIHTACVFLSVREPSRAGMHLWFRYVHVPVFCERPAGCGACRFGKAGSRTASTTMHVWKNGKGGWPESQGLLRVIFFCSEYGRQY